MPSTESDIPAGSGQAPAGAAAGDNRFDGESARRILQRAAAEQQRLSNELSDSYSFEELEEIAAEAGISSEALRAAIEAHGSRSGGAAAGTPLFSGERPGLWTGRRRLMPGHWSKAAKAGVLAATGGVVFLGLLLAFPAVAEMVLWALLLLLVLVTVLIVLGAAPF